MSYIRKYLNEKTVLWALLTRDEDPVTGQSPTVEIRRMDADQYYLDFSNPGTWVDSGGQREQILAEAVWSPGYYFWSFDQSIQDPNNAVDYTIIYRNVDPYGLYATEVVSYSAGGAVFDDVLRIRQYLENDQDLIENMEGINYTHRIYDDDGRVGGNVIHEAEIIRSGNVEERTKQ